MQKEYGLERNDKIEEMIKCLGNVITFKTKIGSMLSELNSMLEQENERSIEDLKILSSPL